MSKINITTLGCPKNIVDSRHLKSAFLSEGFEHVDDASEADIRLVNTCGFIGEAKEESIGEILRIAEMIGGEGACNKGREKGTAGRLVVFGCLAKRYREELLREIPEIDAVWGVEEEQEIIEYCKRVRDEQPRTRRGVTDRTVNTQEGAARMPIREVLPSALATRGSSYAYLKIAEGCDKRCTFCVIPSIRGSFRSQAPEAIVREAQDFVERGTRELILVAQDSTNFGKELRGYSLVSLLKDIAAVPGDFRIRLLYLYPTAIDEELISYMAGEEKMCKYLDIPFQHSEDRLLRLMGRRGTRKEYLKLIRNIRRSIPGVALRTTFIVGFPTETEADFNGLVDFVEEVRFDRLGVFRYSREEGTPAAKLKGQVPEKIKIRRLDEIMKRQALISLEKNKDLIGRRFDALVDEIEGGVAIARLYSHAPEVDGVVIIEDTGIQKDNRKVAMPKAGDIVSVEIIDAFDYDVKGRLI